MYKISIIVPVYQVKEYLYECLNSIKFQTFTNWELIIIDDGSTDGSELICDNFASENVKVIHQSNKGLSMARNVGLEMASGEYISFIDSDDVIKSDFLEKLVFIAEQYKADIICTHLQSINKKTIFEDSEKITLFNNEEAMKELLLQNLFNHGVCTKLYKDSLAKQIKFLEGYTSEDVLYSYQLFKLAKKIVFTTYRGYLYRVRPNSISTSAFCIKNFDLIKLLNYIKQDIYTNYFTLYPIFLDKVFYSKLYYLKMVVTLKNYNVYKNLYDMTLQDFKKNIIAFLKYKDIPIRTKVTSLFLLLLPKKFIIKLSTKFISKYMKSVSEILHDSKTYIH